MGTAVVTVSETDYIQSRRVIFGTIHLSTSYAAGGDAITCGAFGLERIDSLNIEPALNPGGTTLSMVMSAILPTATGPAATGKVQGFFSNSTATYLAEVSGDTSAYVSNYTAIGW